MSASSSPKRPGSGSTSKSKRLRGLLTPKETASLLGISDRLLRELVYTKKLRRVDLGPKTKRFDPRDVEALIEMSKRKLR